MTRAFFYFSLLSQKKNISTEFCELGSQYKHLYIFFPLLSVICGQWKVTFIFILFFQSCQPQPIMRAGCSLPSLVESELSRMAVTNVERPPTVSQMKIITLQSPLTLFSLLTEGKVPAGPSNEKLHGEFEMEKNTMSPSSREFLDIQKTGDHETLFAGEKKTKWCFEILFKIYSTVVNEYISVKKSSRTAVMMSQVSGVND